MTDTDIITNSSDPPSHTDSDSIITTLTNQMTEALSKVQVSTSTTENSTTPIGIKLDGSNYALWSHVVEMYISDKDKLGYINNDCPPPQADPSFRKWRTIMPLSNDG
ncbi:hypothetical protein AAG906_031842 [Vitis piasezkii]